jgi:hypothetical protein
LTQQNVPYLLEDLDFSLKQLWIRNLKR